MRLGIWVGIGRRQLASLAAVLLLLQVGCSRGVPPAAADLGTLAQVGERLFNDPRLGADGQTSCASCHDAKRAFTDGRAVSIGAFGRAGTRNSPSLLGLPEQGPQFWDGREKTLSSAVMQPFSNPREMGHDSLASVLVRIGANAEYRAAFGERISEAQIASALTSYLGSLRAGESTFDRAHTSGDYRLLGEDAQRGFGLFRDKAQCASCHLTTGERPSFSDGAFHHASVGFERIAGNIRALQQRVESKRAAGEPIGHTIMADKEIAELGRFAVTAHPRDLGAFRTPSLRNVARTAPYMHDGSVATLEEAVEHELYYRGLATGEPIKLTVQEQRELAAFLRTLDSPQVRPMSGL